MKRVLAAHDKAVVNMSVAGLRFYMLYEKEIFVYMDTNLFLHTYCQVHSNASTTSV